MNDIVTLTSALPLPRAAVTIREATMDDVRFIDSLQKIHSKQVGFMPEGQLRGKIEAGEVIVADDASGQRIGYCIGTDRYFKHDDVGIIYQLNVAPGKQRGFIGAALLRAMFDRAAYGCKLFCCWCAQDIAANRFWEAMGFVPLAFRAGSEKKARVHIFWQKRIRAGDQSTPWWFPAKTGAGALREDRLVLPIPLGRHWSAEMPRILPTAGVPTAGVPTETVAIEDQREPRKGHRAKSPISTSGPVKHGPRQFGPPPTAGAIAAADLSAATAAEAERLAVNLLPFHPAWSAQWIATLVRERGRVSLYGLENRLTDADIRRVAPALLPVFESWETRERRPQLVAAAISLGRRLRAFDGLTDPRLLHWKWRCRCTDAALPLCFGFSATIPPSVGQ